MPALVKEKFVKTIPTPTRVYSKSIGHSDVKRLGPSRRISTKRSQTHSIQTQTVLETLIESKGPTRVDGQTQTIDFIENDNETFATRLVNFIGGTIVSFMKFFKQIS